MKPSFLAVLALGLFGCGVTGTDPEPGTVVVTFEHRVGVQPLALNEARFRNAAGQTYSVTLLEYIVSNLRLEHGDGATTEIADVLYHRAGAGTLTATADVPPGPLGTLAFTLGLPGAENTTGALPNTQDFNNMSWPEMLGGGYHYMRLEGRYADGAGAFTVHTGPTQGADYSVGVRLPLDRKADDNRIEIQVVMDVNEWFRNPTVYDFDQYVGAIMGNATAQAVLQDNGATVFSIGAIRVQ